LKQHSSDNDSVLQLAHGEMTTIVLIIHSPSETSYNRHFDKIIVVATNQVGVAKCFEEKTFDIDNYAQLYADHNYSIPEKVSHALEFCQESKDPPHRLLDGAPHYSFIINLTTGDNHKFVTRLDNSPNHPNFFRSVLFEIHREFIRQCKELYSTLGMLGLLLVATAIAGTFQSNELNTVSQKKESVRRDGERSLPSASF